MDNVVLMAILDSIGNNSHNHLALSFTKCLSSFLNVLEELATLHKVHNEADVPLILESLQKADDTWMVELFEDFYFNLKGFEVFITHLLLAHDFASVPLPSLPILDPFDGGKGAFAERVLYLVLFFDVRLIALHYNKE